MKKNILLVPSLLALSLVATAPLLGMELEYKEKQPTPQGKPRKQRHKAQQKKIQDIQQQIVEDHEHYQIEQNVDFEIFHNPLYNSEAYIPSNLVQSETESMDLALPERVTHNNTSPITEEPTVAEKKNNQKPYRTYEVQQIKTTAQATSDFPEAKKNHVFSYDPTKAVKRSDLYQERTKIENDPVLDIQKGQYPQTENGYSQREITKITPKSYVSAKDLEQSPLYNRHNPDKQEIVLPTIILELPADNNVGTEESSVQTQEVVVETQDITESNPLFQSVMMPTEKKELDYWTRLNTRLFNVISNIKSFLQNRTYDVENLEYSEMLHAAFTQAQEANDFDTIMKIAELCQSTEDYKNKIRINDETATSALNVLSTKYNTEVNNSNSKINDIHDTLATKYDERTVAFAYTLNQVMSAYLADVKGISEEATSRYAAAREQEESRIKGMQESITTFSKLNASIRPAITELLTLTIQPKENKFAEQFAQSDEQLKSLLGLSEKMPKMNINLQLTDK